MTPVFDFQCHETSGRDGKVELPEDKLQIGQAAGERIDRHDVAMAANPLVKRMAGARQS